MKVSVDKNLCAGTWMCTAIAPEIFKVGKDGKSEVYQIKKEFLNEALEAEEMCPVGAITVENID